MMTEFQIGGASVQFADLVAAFRDGCRNPEVPAGLLELSGCDLYSDSHHARTSEDAIANARTAGQSFGRLCTRLPAGSLSATAPGDYWHQHGAHAPVEGALFYALESPDDRIAWDRILVVGW
jgi:hypothetical protein